MANEVDLEKLKYPIGMFSFTPPTTTEHRQERVAELAATTARLREAVAGLSEDQLDTPYRPGGWTVRQVAHHLADASMQGYTRTKLALTEDTPPVKPFDEDPWAALIDSTSLPVEPSLQLMDGLYTRWITLLKSLPPEAFAKGFQHPQTGFNTLDRMLAFFVWHGKHHTAHITSLRERNGW
ncbi:YfiT family bacillithiol transferase [Cohnella soli]|uniref:Putative metal-dependent hydrolase ACFPOF_20990 n=1 Tax=Cohnella soli TaxID=425005 RepID=A0ABW0HVU5_9BACL